MDEDLEKALGEVGAALKAVANKVTIEELVNTGLALVLSKQGILDAVGIEIIRSVGKGLHTDATLLAALDERIDGLHSLADSRSHEAGSPPKH